MSGRINTFLQLRGMLSCPKFLTATRHLQVSVTDRQTDKYFISRSGQTIDIEQNLQITERGDQYESGAPGHQSCLFRTKCILTKLSVATMIGAHSERFKFVIYMHI